MTQYSGVKAALGNLDDERWTIKSNRFEVFALPVQCAEEVNEVSRRTPRCIDK